MSQQLELLTENPLQWTAVTHVTSEIQKKQIKPFVALALKELEGNPDSRLSSLMNADKYAAVRAVVRHVARLRSADREPWRQQHVKSFLEGLRFAPDCVEELSLLLCTEQVYEHLPTHLRVKPGLASLQWKIDISLCQSRLAAGAERRRPAARVLLSLALTDGRARTYPLSLDKFHELRYVIASALKSMIVLEKRKCMRRD